MIHSLRDVSEAVKLGTTLTRSWFRGQAEPYDNLTPAIFRDMYAPIEAARGPIEFSVAAEFKRRSPAHADRLPAWEDHLSWLFLMQHHGLPTRLLDWSENVLVALYFAVRSSGDKDGELWALYPDELNRRSGFFGLPLPNHQAIRFLAAEPWHNAPLDLARELGLSTPQQYPVAVLPPVNSERILAQASAFTIHPRPTVGCTIPELLSEPKYLIKYTVPASMKRGILADLGALRITEDGLFPGLDSLTRRIIEQHHVVGYSPPEPPKL